MTYTKTPITAKEVSLITGIKEKTILNRGAGTEVLTRKKFGRLVRFIRPQVEAFAEGKPLTEIRRLG